MSYGDFQNEIYAQGLQGVVPALPMAYADWEAKAQNALPPSAVGIGRPYAWGMALGGADGTVHILRALLAEADLTMAVDGYQSLKDLGPDALRRTPPITT